MNKKGFTLIELIITIALLGIISLLSFVAVNKVIEKSKENNCKSLVSNIEMAATEYVSDHRYERSFAQAARNNSNIYVISVADLIAKNYLQGPIINPFTNEKLTDGTNSTANELGAIKVRLTLNTDYTVSRTDVFIDDSDNSVNRNNIEFILTCKK